MSNSSSSSNASSGGTSSSEIAAQLQAMTAQLEAMRAENARLAQTVASLNTSRKADLRPAVAATNSASEPPAGAPRKSYGEMKIWTGTWNMGAADPFLEMSLDREKETVSKMLTPFIPLGYDLYVLGVQEGISDKVFEAVEAHTGTFRLPLNAKLYPAREHTQMLGKAVRSRRLGRAINVQAFIDDARAGIFPEAVASTSDMLDRVWGRGDGALLTPKFTGIAVFVSPVVAPYCRLLGVYKHSFGASEGSKGGVGVALGLYDVTVAFLSCHMASKRPDLRRAQYCELVDRLGAKLGGRGFGLNDEFHHIVWMGDTNYHVHGVTSREAVSAIARGDHMKLLLDHDELLDDKERELAFYEYEEPLMGPRFFPTYKKVTNRGRINYRSPAWVDAVYLTKFKEPFYKGGREADRVPSWTDRIQYHSLPDRSGELLPEPLDPEHPETSLHNYHSVNDGIGLDCSDHSPVYATFSLQISSEDVDEALVSAREALQAEMGYTQDPDDDEGGDGAAASSSGSNALTSSYRPPPSLGPMSDADFSALPPAQRPLEVILSVRNILVEYRGAMQPPRAVNLLFPLPYEDSNDIPDRTKVVRTGGSLFSFSSSIDGRVSLNAILPPCCVSQASKLEALHLLIKVSLDDNTKAQCVICMRDGGFLGAGAHVNTFLLPLTSNGLPFKDPSTGRLIQVKFELKMEAYERGGTMATAASSALTSASSLASSSGYAPSASAGGGGGGRTPTGGRGGGVAASTGGAPLSLLYSPPPQMQLQLPSSAASASASLNSSSAAFSSAIAASSSYAASAASPSTLASTGASFRSPQSGLGGGGAAPFSIYSGGGGGGFALGSNPTPFSSPVPNMQQQQQQQQQQQAYASPSTSSSASAAGLSSPAAAIRSATAASAAAASKSAAISVSAAARIAAASGFGGGAAAPVGRTFNAAVSSPPPMLLPSRGGNTPVGGGYPGAPSATTMSSPNEMILAARARALAARGGVSSQNLLQGGGGPLSR